MGSSSGKEWAQCPVIDGKIGPETVFPENDFPGNFSALVSGDADAVLMKDMPC